MHIGLIVSSQQLTACGLAKGRVCSPLQCPERVCHTNIDVLLFNVLL